MHSNPLPNGHSTAVQTTYSTLVYHAYQTLNSIKELRQVKLDGESLDIPSVVAVSRYHFSHPTTPILAYTNHI